jgi:hypothetical protein
MLCVGSRSTAASPASSITGVSVSANACSAAWMFAGLEPQRSRRPTRSCFVSHGAIVSDVTKFCSMNRPSSWPMRSLFSGTIAVWGSGRPNGCRNSATTANQSARPPISDASAKNCIAANSGYVLFKRPLTTSNIPISGSKASAISLMRRRRCRFSNSSTVHLGDVSRRRERVAATPPIYALTEGRKQSWHHATMTGWRDRMVGAWGVDITVR